MATLSWLLSVALEAQQGEWKFGIQVNTAHQRHFPSTYT